MTVTILQGDALTRLRDLPDASVHCCVTSPPYMGLRAYLPDGHPDKHLEMGSEPTLADYIAGMVAVFREVRRVLRDDGTLWLNIGDSYASGYKGTGGATAKQSTNAGSFFAGRKFNMGDAKAKDLLMVPARLAIALQDDGWYLRSDIIFHKPNPMPESVRDRPSSAHEHVFLLTKRPSYYYDADAVRSPPSDALLQQIQEGYNGTDTKDFMGVGVQSASGTKARIIENARAKIDKQRGHGRRHADFNDRWDNLTRDEQMTIGANLRNVWTIATRPYSGAHFATMPPALVEPCILAGTSERGCCAKCGTPWKRRVDRKLVKGPAGCNRSVTDKRDATADANDQGSNRQKDGHMPGWIYQTTTTGWVSTCECEQTKPPVPAIVLDPFAGVFTTSLVAERLGRDSIGIELNPASVELGRERLTADAPLFAAIA